MLDISLETERLARLVAVKSGRAPEEVVREAVAQQAAHLGVLPEARPRRIDLSKVEEIVRRCASRPVLDKRSPDEVIGYDAFGVPE